MMSKGGVQGYPSQYGPPNNALTVNTQPQPEGGGHECKSIDMVTTNTKRKAMARREEASRQGDGHPLRLELNLELVDLRLQLLQ